MSRSRQLLISSSVRVMIGYLPTPHRHVRFFGRFSSAARYQCSTFYDSLALSFRPFSVVRASFSLVHLPSAFSRVFVIPLSSSHARTSSSVYIRYIWNPCNVVSFIARRPDWFQAIPILRFHTCQPEMAKMTEIFHQNGWDFSSKWLRFDWDFSSLPRGLDNLAMGPKQHHLYSKPEYINS